MDIHVHDYVVLYIINIRIHFLGDINTMLIRPTSSYVATTAPVVVRCVSGGPGFLIKRENMKIILINQTICPI